MTDEKFSEAIATAREGVHRPKIKKSKKTKKGKKRTGPQQMTVRMRGEPDTPVWRNDLNDPERTSAPDEALCQH